MDLIFKHGSLHHGSITKYPDGQRNIELDLEYFNNPKDPITIKCSVRDFGELEILLCIVAALRKNDFFIKEIDFKYLFGMRSDRSFSPGSPNYFRDVVAPIINSLNIPIIKILHPHSKLSANAINNVLPYFIPLEEKFDHCLMIGGDKSAVCCRIDYDYNDQEIYFNKKRIDGKIEVSLSKEHLEYLDNIKDRPLLIFDDLCDGGGTFIAIAKYLYDLNILSPSNNLYLFVTHGLFQNKFFELLTYYKKIITTNSYQEFTGLTEVIDVWT
jgi:ribose-phosphate pyrophosphokinase